MTDTTAMTGPGIDYADDFDDDRFGDDDPPAPVQRVDKRRAGSDEPSLLDELQKDLASGGKVEEVRWAVGTRPGYSVALTTDLDAQKVKQWMKQATPKKARRTASPDAADVDEARLCCLIVGNHMVGLYKDGRLIPDRDGDAMTFASDDFLEMTQAPRVADAVKTFFVTDGEVISHGRALMREAGLSGDEGPDEDPTPAS